MNQLNCFFNNNSKQATEQENAAREPVKIVLSDTAKFLFKSPATRDSSSNERNLLTVFLFGEWNGCDVGLGLGYVEVKKGDGHCCVIKL